MPDKVRNKRKLEKQQKAASKHGHGHTNGSGMSGDHHEDEQHARGGTDGEFADGHGSNDR